MKKIKLAFIALVLLVFVNTATAQTKFYVSISGSDANDGSSWNNAFQTLQKALSTASSGSQIWVAQGTYYPDQGGGQTSGDRNASFTMHNGVAIYGGFAGTESNLNDRNWNINVTILSGEIGTAGNIDDNIFHVVTANMLDNTTLLDGFTVTRGNAGGDAPVFAGGGIYNENGSPILKNISVVSNTSFNGGGMYNRYDNIAGSPLLINVAFLNNSGLVRAGGLYDEANAILINVSFQGNSSPQGGAMWSNNVTNSTITNCVFWNNGGDNTSYHEAGMNFTATYSLFDASVTGYMGSNNITTTTSPFVSSTSVALSGCAPAIDAGNNTAVPSDVTADLYSNPRIANATGKPSAIVDMGAAEFVGNAGINCTGYANATSLNTTNITAHSARLNWIASSNPAKWQVQYTKASRSAKWITRKVAGSTRSLSVSLLAANQTYKWRIKAKCGIQWTSFSNVVSFKTSSAQFVSTATTEQAIQLKNVTEEKTLTIKLYPNPTRGQFTIELHLVSNINTNAKIELLNMMGQTVSTDNASINNGTLHKNVSISSSLTAGIYIVKVVVNDKTYVSKLMYEK